MEPVVERVFTEIRDLAPVLNARAEELESARNLPADLVEALSAIGIFRLFVPRSVGGLEFDLPMGLEAIEVLAKLDGSVGWTAMVNGGAALFAPLLPRKTFERIYQDGPDAILAGSAVVGGTAVNEQQGWLVTGRWPFASGSQHADWILGVCVMTHHGKPMVKMDGKTPDVRAFFLPKKEWTIEDTWYAFGLKGTGSTHIALDSVRVPEENFFELSSAKSSIEGPLYRAVPYLVPLLHGAVHLGIASGALEDILALARSGWSYERAESMARESELFRNRIGKVSADLRAARAFYANQVTRNWQHLISNSAADPVLLGESGQTAIWVAETCAEVVEACFELAGSRAVYESSRLQRRLRDIRVATQHSVVQRRNYTKSGTRLLAEAV